jgi:hypothetical protein
MKLKTLMTDLELMHFADGRNVSLYINKRFVFGIWDRKSVLQHVAS